MHFVSSIMLLLIVYLRLLATALAGTQWVSQGTSYNHITGTSVESCKVQCELLGMHMLTWGTSEEYNAVYAEIFNRLGDGNVCTAFNDRGRAVNDFVDECGRPLPPASWQAGNPDNAQNRVGSEDCVLMHQTGLRDELCSTVGKCVCQYPGCAGPTTSTTPTTIMTAPAEEPTSTKPGIAQNPVGQNADGRRSNDGVDVKLNVVIISAGLVVISAF